MIKIVTKMKFALIFDTMTRILSRVTMKDSSLWELYTIQQLEPLDRGIENQRSTDQQVVL